MNHRSFNRPRALGATLSGGLAGAALVLAGTVRAGAGEPRVTAAASWVEQKAMMLTGTKLRTFTVEGSNAHRERSCFAACRSEARCAGATVIISPISTTPSICYLWRSVSGARPAASAMSIWRGAPATIFVPSRQR